MKQRAYVAGVGMTAFGRFADRGLKSLAGEAIRAALADAGIEASDVQAAYTGTAAAGVMTGQVMAPGQMVLRAAGIGRIPVVNVENACATSATAFEQACTMVTLGRYDVVLALGFEKLHAADKRLSFSVFRGAVDVEDIDAVLASLGGAGGEQGAGTSRSLFMDVYANLARSYAERSGATPRHFAMVSAKNAAYGSLNPRAQFRQTLTVDEVLRAPLVVDPLTLPMCCPLGDGAAAVVVVSERRAAQLGSRRCVRVRAVELASGWDRTEDELPDVVGWTALQAYEAAGIGPSEMDVVELHDATAPAELICCEQLGLCASGGGPAFIESGASGPGGQVSVNPSGGLLRKGHPVGATGCAQIVELTEQLRGESGARQHPGARIALAENGGGWIGNGPAAIVISVLEAVS